MLIGYKHLPVNEVKPGGIELKPQLPRATSVWNYFNHDASMPKICHILVGPWPQFLAELINLVACYRYLYRAKAQGNCHNGNHYPRKLIWAGLTAY